MFQHLDDPDTPVLGDSFRERVVARGRARRQRTRAAAFSLALVPMLAAGSSMVYLRSQADELDRVAVGGLAELPPPDTSPTSEPDVIPAAPITAPMNILVVGVDRRPPGDEALGSRSDSIGVVRIDPDGGRVSLLSVPRDLWVTDAAGRSDRINAFLPDGPTALVDVVSATLGVDINHYVEVDFEGFVRLIDLAGGVTVPFDAALRDESTGFAIEPGCQTLDGDDTLAYVRARRLQQFDPASGEWVQDATSDLGRVARQQDVVDRLFRQILAADYGATDQVRILTDVIDDITVDDGLDLDGLRSIFATASAIGADRFVASDLVAGLSPETILGQSVLAADPVVLDAIVGQFLDPTPGVEPTPPAILDDAIVPTAPAC
jgi:LCP family protein required for cell wall assembly